MLSFFGKYKMFGIVLLVLSVIIISVIYSILKPVEVLPVYQPSSVNAEMVDPSIQHQKKYHTIGDFSLTNQNGETITQDNYNDKIYVADFFFTICPDICKDMAVQKRRLQDAMLAENNFVILSHSVTPIMDSVPVMKAYGELQGAIEGRWHLLTGDKKHIYDLARKSYFSIFDGGGKGDETDFIHTENFILVDPDKRIRGYYDGTSAEDVDRLMADFYILKLEYPY